MREGYKDTELTYDIYQELGECYLQVGKVREAQRHFEQALQCRPQSDRTFVGLAVAALQSGDLGQAEQFFRRACQLNEGNDKAWCGLGIVAAASGSGPREGVWEHFRHALEINNENLSALQGLLELSYELNRLLEAEEYLRRYLELHVADFNILYCLAGVCFQMGKYPEAEDALERILVFQPDNALARELQQEIARRTGTGGGWARQQACS